MAALAPQLLLRPLANLAEGDLAFHGKLDNCAVNDRDLALSCHLWQTLSDNTSAVFGVRRGRSRWTFRTVFAEGVVIDALGSMRLDGPYLYSGEPP